MTKTLKKQLLAVGAGALLLAAAPTLLAKNHGAETPAEAAQNFAVLLEETLEANQPYSSLRYETLQQGPLDEQSQRVLLEELAVDARRGRFEVRGQKKEGGKIVVQVAALDRIALPVVVVENKGRFLVDLPATYGKRKGLRENGELQTAILQKTNIALPGLPGLDKPEVQSKICQGNLRQLHLAMSQYVQDYDEVFPPTTDWQKGLVPYLHRVQSYHCPSTPGKKQGYAYNSNLALKSMPELAGTPDYHNRVLFYETTNLVEDAAGTGQDMAFRHERYGKPVQTLAFLDGRINQATANSTYRFDFPILAPKTAPIMLPPAQ